MKEKKFIQWQALRKKGKIRFCIENGALGWGLPMLIIMAFINHPFENGLVSNEAIIHYIIWPVGGIFFGLGVWYFSERAFNKVLNSQEKQP